MPFLPLQHVTFQHDNARPHIAGICREFRDNGVSVPNWAPYSLSMSQIEHVWDDLDQRVRQRVPVPENVRQLRVAVQEEWMNIPQVNSMHCRCTALHDANGGHTR